MAHGLKGALRAGFLAFGFLGVLAACAPTPEPSSNGVPYAPISEAAFNAAIAGNILENVRGDTLNKILLTKNGEYIMAGHAGQHSGLLSIQGGAYTFKDGVVCMKRAWREGSNQNSGCITITTNGEDYRCRIQWGSSSSSHRFGCLLRAEPHGPITEKLGRLAKGV